MIQVLIIKSVLEALLVVSLAVFTFIRILPADFHGSVEVTSEGLSGWVVNSAAPWDRVEVQLFIDGKFVASRVANESRPELVTQGRSKDEWHGYTFPLRSLTAGMHEARVYSLHSIGDRTRKTLRLVGDPIIFSREPGEEIIPVEPRLISK